MSDYPIAGDVHRQIDRDVSRAGTFTVTEQHLALLGRAYVRWDDCEFGAPAIDPKRPYGNSSVERDIAEILNEPEWQTAVEEDDRHDDDAAKDYYLSRNYDRLVRVHAEVGVALQVALTTRRFAAGEYRLAKDYDSTSWQPVTPKAPRAADLPEGSIVAGRDFVYMKLAAGWLVTGQDYNEDEAEVDNDLRQGATVLRHGYGTDK